MKSFKQRGRVALALLLTFGLFALGLAGCRKEEGGTGG